MNDKEFFDKYDDILLSGLQSTKTYVLLHRQKSKGVHLALRPMILRASPLVVVAGGKLRVGVDEHYNLEDARKLTPAPINSEAAVNMLREAYQFRPWQKEDPTRLSTVVVIGFSAGLWNGGEAIEALVDKTTEAMLGCAKHAVGTRLSNIRHVRNCLRGIYAQQAISVFEDKQEIVKTLDAADLGKTTPILNKADPTQVSKVVVDFANKLAAKQKTKTTT